MSSKELRKCNNCYVRATEKQLQKCSRCRVAFYCSAECQKAHWKAHKPHCKANSTLSETLKEYASTPLGSLDSLSLPDGVSRYELDLRLEKWVKFHTPVMMWACLHALELPRDISRTKTHVMYIKLRPRHDHGGSAAKYFEATEAYPVAIEEAFTYPAPWPESLMALQQLQAESENMNGGHVTAALIECSPLAVQTVPFGSLRHLDEPMIPSWKEHLFKEIKEGRSLFKERRTQFL